jgi:hypothetical protein
MTTRKHTSSRPRTVAVVSLGCAKNTVDSEVMMGRLAEASFALVQDPAEAEIVVVNTCGFIEAAKKESIDAILQAAKFKKGGKLKILAVGGCLAQRYGDELRKELPEIDLMFGLNEIESLADRLDGGPFGFPEAEGESGAGTRHLCVRCFFASIAIDPEPLRLCENFGRLRPSMRVLRDPPNTGQVPKPHPLKTSNKKSETSPPKAFGKSAWWLKIPLGTASTCTENPNYRNCYDAYRRWNPSRGFGFIISTPLGWI